mgnify:CR=1 FL=1
MELRGPKLEPAIKEALKVGYRHFDGAAIYENEAELGAVFATITDSLIPRSEVIFSIHLAFLSLHSYSLRQNFGLLT